MSATSQMSRPVTAPRGRPMDGWTEGQIEHARRIVAEIPDASRKKYVLMRALEVIIFVILVAISILLVELHPALIVVAWLIGLLGFDFGYMRNYSQARRDLDWARQVLADGEAVITR